MTWICEALEVFDKLEGSTGRYRMTATSDEVGGPFGDTSHDHATIAEAGACDLCDEFLARIMGVPSFERRAAVAKAVSRAEYARGEAQIAELEARLDTLRRSLRFSEATRAAWAEQHEALLSILSVAGRDLPIEDLARKCAKRMVEAEAALAAARGEVK
jgi:hypothetical protein